MNRKMPGVTASDVIGVLEKIGFSLIRKSGSHRIYKNKSGKRVTVPYHSGKVLHPKILKSILSDSDLLIDKFKDLLR